MSDPAAYEAQLAAVNQVRLLISDTANSPVFTSSEIMEFLVLESGNVKRAAAQALDVIASNEAMVSKVITSQGLTTNGKAVADALRSHSTALRAQADLDFEAAGFVFDVVEFDIYGSPELTESPYAGGRFPHEPF